MPTAVIRISDPSAANTVSSVEPEARRDLLRTHTEIRMEGDEAVLTISAADTSAMRAALNSYLECIKVIEDVQRLTEVRR